MTPRDKEEKKPKLTIFPTKPRKETITVDNKVYHCLVYKIEFTVGPMIMVYIKQILPNHRSR